MWYIVLGLILFVALLAIEGNTFIISYSIVNALNNHKYKNKWFTNKDGNEVMKVINCGSRHKYKRAQVFIFKKSLYGGNQCDLGEISLERDSPDERRKIVDKDLIASLEREFVSYSNIIYARKLKEQQERRNIENKNLLETIDALTNTNYLLEHPNLDSKKDEEEGEEPDTINDDGDYDKPKKRKKRKTVKHKNKILKEEPKKEKTTEDGSRLDAID